MKTVNNYKKCFCCGMKYDIRAERKKCICGGHLYIVGTIYQEKPKGVVTNE